MMYYTVKGHKRYIMDSERFDIVYLNIPKNDIL